MVCLLPVRRKLSFSLRLRVHYRCVVTESQLLSPSEVFCFFSALTWYIGCAFMFMTSVCTSHLFAQAVRLVALRPRINEHDSTSCCGRLLYSVVEASAAARWMQTIRSRVRSLLGGGLWRRRPGRTSWRPGLRWQLIASVSAALWARRPTEKKSRTRRS